MAWSEQLKFEKLLCLYRSNLQFLITLMNNMVHFLMVYSGI